VVDNVLGSSPDSVLAARIGSDTDVDLLVALKVGAVDVFYNDGSPTDGGWSNQASLITGLSALPTYWAPRLTLMVISISWSVPPVITMTWRGIATEGRWTGRW
jgi:hypothetical protein